MKRSGSGVHVFQLAFDHMEGILNTYYSYVWYLYRRTLRQSYVCAVAYRGHFCFGGDLTKPSITIASVDRFYLNLAICLQLNIALLFQNSVNIWHCLSELWQCIQGVTFFVDTVQIMYRHSIKLSDMFVSLRAFFFHHEYDCSRRLLVSNTDKGRSLSGKVTTKQSLTRWNLGLQWTSVALSLYQ